MHFALPNRKDSRSSPYNAATSFSRRAYTSNLARRRGIQIIAGLVLFILLWVLSRGTSSTFIPAGTQETVICVLLDRTRFEKMDNLQRMLDNRKAYAERHGYGIFVGDTADYELGGAAADWARIPFMRHALAVHPYATNFFFLEANSIIMNPALPLSTHLLDPSVLDPLMLRDASIVPPVSVIKTYRHVPAKRIQFILTLDHEGVHPGSFILRRNWDKHGVDARWCEYFLDVWFDPLYRSYNFARGSQHALEHIAQWHPTLLAKLALVPQRRMNSYPEQYAGSEEAKYGDGDFVVHFAGCEGKERSCDKEFELFWDKRRTS